jgi:hypothetical protein
MGHTISNHAYDHRSGMVGVATRRPVNTRPERGKSSKHLTLRMEAHSELEVAELGLGDAALMNRPPQRAEM